MTTTHPQQDNRPDPSPRKAGYVPAFDGADGSEDPAPEAVVHSTPPAPADQRRSGALAEPRQDAEGTAGTASADAAARLPADRSSSLPADDDEDGRFTVAEEISFDQQSDAVRRVGQLPLDFAGAEVIPQEQADVRNAMAQALHANAPAASGGLRRPGDETGPESAQSGEDVCPECQGSGRNLAGLSCANCGGSGTVVRIVGDA